MEYYIINFLNIFLINSWKYQILFVYLGMKKLLWLDDIRDPMTGDWINKYASGYADSINQIFWVKNYKQFVNWITENGLPDIICFDHDLAFEHYTGFTSTEKTGYDCAKWLVDYCIRNKVPLPDWKIQSMNPVGRDNINGLLNNYLKFSK